jgi:hypothetical protein
MNDAQLSLCGNKGKSSGITDELFNAHLVTFEAFANNPLIVNDPNLVARIGGKCVIRVERGAAIVLNCLSLRFYDWRVASALITSVCIFHKPLPAETIEQLQEKHMHSNIKSRSTASGGWWPFYGKKVNIV